MTQANPGPQDPQDRPAQPAQGKSEFHAMWERLAKADLPGRKAGVFRRVITALRGKLNRKEGP